MSDLEARFRLSVTGGDELAAFFTKSGERAKAFGRETVRALEDTARSVASKAGEIGRGLLSIGGIGAGLGIAEQAKNVLELRDQLTQLAATSGLPVSAIGDLTEKIEGAAKASNQFSGELVGALMAFKSGGGDLKTGIDNLELYGKVATATGISVQEVARAAAGLEKLGLSGGKGFSMFAQQRDLLTVMPTLLSAFETGNITDAGGVGKGVALARSMRQTLGDPGKVALSMQNAFGAIEGKGGELRAAGVNTNQNGVDVLLDAIRKAKGNEEILMNFFGGRAMKGINPLAKEFRETGGFGTFDKYLAQGAQNNEGTIDAMFQSRRSSGLQDLKATRIQLEQSSNRNFGDLADSAARHSGVIASGYDFATAHPLAVGAGAFGALTLKNLVGNLVGGGGASLGGGGGAGGLLRALPGAKGVPVFVTNAGDMGGGLAGPAGAALKGAAEAERGLLSMITKNAGWLAAAGGAGFAVGTYADQKLGLSDAIAGVRKGEIAAKANAADESSGGRAGRELGIAQDLAKQVRSGKLSPEAAGDQLEAFSRSLEHQQFNSGLSGPAAELANELRGGKLDRISGRSEDDIRNEQLSLERKRARGELAAMPLGQGPLAAGAPAGQGTVLADGSSVLNPDDWAAALRDAFKMTMNVTIHGDEATVENETGVRRPAVKVRRTTAGG